MKNTKLIYRNSHFSTIIPSLFRKIDEIHYNREEVLTPDHDFFHIDKLENKNQKVLILLHGLEGSSKEHYIKGQALKFYKNNFDVYAMNYRSCSGEMNRTTKLYHSGETEDLRFLINKIIEEDRYQEISLVGFSLGANVILKYLGEEGENVSSKIKAAVSISVPMDLRGCSYELAKGFSKLYSLHFMRTLRKKVTYLKKMHNHNSLKNINVKKLKTFLDFDELVTAPLHGFTSAEDYWEKSSSKQFLRSIKIPTKIINALNDPFLSKDCYPSKKEISNPYIETSYPKFGGHVGFIRKNLNEEGYLEIESYSFVSTHHTNL